MCVCVWLSPPAYACMDVKPFCSGYTKSISSYSTVECVIQCYTSILLTVPAIQHCQWEACTPVYCTCTRSGGPQPPEVELIHIQPHYIILFRYRGTCMHVRTCTTECVIATKVVYIILVNAELSGISWGLFLSVVSRLSLPCHCLNFPLFDISIQSTHDQFFKGRSLVTVQRA